ncbi:hypothetical protein GCM10027592_62100 [Spirosoma flavus]
MEMFTAPSPRAFTKFYDKHAPRLWGLILLANLPPSQSETILINTIRKAWKQAQLPQSDTFSFSQILLIAHQEGLPKNSSLLTTLRQIRHS